jgi:predicted phosphodiesterase
MKTLILSDLHSNIHALEAVWAKERDCDRVYCLGDLVDYGPYPNEVLAWIRAHDIPCVQGNHDAWVALNYRRGQTLETLPVQERGWVNYTASLLSEEEIIYLEQLPGTMTAELDGRVYGMTHLYKDYEEIVSLHAYEAFCEQKFPGTRLEALVLGHTHRQAVRYLSDRVKWLNPGSISYRRKDDPDQTAHYATITDGVISLKRLDYNFRPVYMAMSRVELKESEMQAAKHMFGTQKIQGSQQ